MSSPPMRSTSFSREDGHDASRRSAVMPGQHQLVSPATLSRQRCETRRQACADDSLLSANQSWYCTTGNTLTTTCHPEHSRCACAQSCWRERGQITEAPIEVLAIFLFGDPGPGRQEFLRVAFLRHFVCFVDTFLDCFHALIRGRRCRMPFFFEDGNTA